MHHDLDINQFDDDILIFPFCQEMHGDYSVKWDIPDKTEIHFVLCVWFTFIIL